MLYSYLLAVNLIAFACMGIDKGRAKRQGARRISEKPLFLTAILGGALGAVLGMRIFRHKTRHWYFRYGLPVLLLLEAALLLWWYAG